VNVAAPARGTRGGAGWLLALAVVFAVALVWRVGYLERFVPERILVGDEQQYASYALNLVRYGIYSSALPGSEPVPDTYRSPGLPLLGAAIMAIVGIEDASWYRVALYVQALIGALTALLTVLLVRHWLPPAWAIAAGLAIACWPHLIAMTGYFLIETLYAFALVLALWLVARADGAGIGRWVSAGLAVGFATWVNPVALPLVIVLPALVLWSRGWRPALVLLMAAALLPTMWSVTTTGWPGQGAARERAAFNYVFGLYPEGHTRWFAHASVRDPDGTAFLAQVDADTKRVAADTAVAVELLDARIADVGLGPMLRWYLLDKPWLLWDWSIRIGQGDLQVNKLARPPFQVDPPFQLLAAVAKAANPLLVALAGLACAFVLVNVRHREDPRALALAAVVACVLIHTAVHVVLQAEPRYSIPLRPLQLALAIGSVYWLSTRWLAYRAAQTR
jgi:hypothetical protein